MSMIDICKSEFAGFTVFGLSGAEKKMEYEAKQKKGYDATTNKFPPQKDVEWWQSAFVKAGDNKCFDDQVKFEADDKASKVAGSKV